MVTENLKYCDHARVLRQKELEERILKPFRITDGTDTR